jgi:hypothetical protein
MGALGQANYRLTPIILTTQEAEIRRIMIQRQPWTNSWDPISKKNPVIECLPSMCKALGLTPQHCKSKKASKQKKPQQQNKPDWSLKGLVQHYTQSVIRRNKTWAIPEVIDNGQVILPKSQCVRVWKMGMPNHESLSWTCEHVHPLELNSNPGVSYLVVELGKLFILLSFSFIVMKIEINTHILQSFIYFWW